MSDLISREDAFKAIEGLRKVGLINQMLIVYLEDVLNIIEHLPSAEKVGYWEDIDVELYEEADIAIDEWQSARCSCCGRYHTTPYMYYYDHYEYCPSCGARMERKK